MTAATFPPLRSRPEDVPLLLDAFLRRYSMEHRIALPSLTTEARQRLQTYQWPGNVRELKNAAERIVIRYSGGEIGVDDLPAELQQSRSSPARAQAPAGPTRVDNLIERLTQHGESFWSAVHEPFMARDITRGVQLEEELERARDAALESARLKSEFLGNMSHEIRTPMNGIIGMTSLLADTQLDKDQHHFVDGIRESADSLVAIINDLLDFSKIEAGKLRLEFAEFELVPLVEGVLSLFTKPAESKNLELTSSIDADVPTYVHSDSARLRQILINLGHDFEADPGDTLKYENAIQQIRKKYKN